MTTLTDDVLRGNLLPPEGYMDNYVIEGTSEAVEERLKALGWDCKSQRASVIVFFESSMVKYIQIIISGTKELRRATASTLWGQEHHKDSYVKFEPLDLAYLVFIGKMTSHWITQAPN